MIQHAKFVQLAAMPASDVTDATLYALAEDGTVWAFGLDGDEDHQVWRPVPMERQA